MPKPLIFPAITEHRSTVIIAHGFGDSGHGYVPIVRGWQEDGLFRDTKFILPSAPAINVTSAGGRSTPAWFDIRGERGPHVTFETLTQQNNDEEGMLRSRDFFLSLVRDEVDKHAVPASQVILGGFSQGSVMALLTGLTADVQLGGVFCLCGYLPLADAVRQSGEGGKGADKFSHVREGTGTKVLMINGERDPIMNLDWVEKSKNIVMELGYPVDSSVIPYVEIPTQTGYAHALRAVLLTFLTVPYRGLGHSINQEVLAKVADFIEEVQGKGRRQHDEL